MSQSSTQDQSTSEPLTVHPILHQMMVNSIHNAMIGLLSGRFFTGHLLYDIPQDSPLTWGAGKRWMIRLTPP